MAAAASRSEYNAQSAVTWAAGYKFPVESIASDVRCLQAAQLDFVTMVRRRLKTLSGSRMNLDRVALLRADNPERTRLLDLSHGMRVALPAGFVPNGSLPPSPLRATYVAVAPAVNKMLSALQDQRLAFVLPEKLARTHVHNLHLSKAHWTPKKGKPSGRPLGDLTFVDGCPLNTPETAAAAIEMYGPIDHPTINDIATMIWQFWTNQLESNSV